MVNSMVSMRSTGSRSRALAVRGRSTGRGSRSSGARSASRSMRSASSAEAIGLENKFNEPEPVDIDDIQARLSGRRSGNNNRGLGRNADEFYIDNQAIKYQTSPGHMKTALDENRHNVAEAFDKRNKVDMQMELQDNQKTGSLRDYLARTRRSANLEYLFKNGSSFNSEFVQDIVMQERVHKNYDLQFHIYDSALDIQKKLKQRTMLDNMTLRDWLVQAATGAVLPDIDNFKTFDFAQFAMSME